MERDEVPPRILVPGLPEDRSVLEAWLAGRRGGKVSLAVPSRGPKRRLLELVAEDAREHFRAHKLRRASDFAARSRALADLGEQLGLASAPLRIECFDISNLGATDKVGSMVVFEDGLPKRADYRRFEIKDVAGQDDFASMEEMLSRRLARLDDRADRGRRFAYEPALIVVDGGRGQLSAALRALASTGRSIPMIGLAKRLEEVYLPDHAEPLRIPRGSDALFLLQHVRDEAHRFAVSYHRAKRERRALASPLDDVPGVGEARKRALLRRFGSVRRLAAASIEEIAATPGVGPEIARAVHEALTRPAVSANWPDGCGAPWRRIWAVAQPRGSAATRSISPGRAPRPRRVRATAASVGDEAMAVSSSVPRTL